MAAPYRSGDGQRQADCQTCKQADMQTAGGLLAIRASRPPRKQADMQPRRQAGGHAARDARDHRQDGPRFAGQATRGKPDPAACPALGTGGTGSPAGAGASRNRPALGASSNEGDRDSGARSKPRKAWLGKVWKGQRALPFRCARIGRGRRRRGAMPPGDRTQISEAPQAVESLHKCALDLSAYGYPLDLALSMLHATPKMF
jgi:hypothetical protein